MVIKKNPDVAEYEEITEAIMANGGYCCCAVTKTPETKCMCKDFRELETPGYCACGRYYKVPDRPVVTLCGSTRFRATFERLARELTLQGNVVLTVNVFEHSGDWGLSEEEKAMLDIIHKQKIAMSDWVYIINQGGYIGESTQAEIEWAKSLGKKVKYLEEQA